MSLKFNSISFRAKANSFIIVYQNFVLFTRNKSQKDKQFLYKVVANFARRSSHIHICYFLTAHKLTQHVWRQFFKNLFPSRPNDRLQWNERQCRIRLQTCMRNKWKCRQTIFCIYFLFWDKFCSCSSQMMTCQICFSYMENASGDHVMGLFTFI